MIVDMMFFVVSVLCIVLIRLRFGMWFVVFIDMSCLI